MAHTSWADAWLDALFSFSHPGRMRRGRSLAKKKSIKNLDVKPGEIHAEVKDDGKRYQVTLRLPPLDDASWQKITKELSGQALYSARLLGGELPPEVMDLFEAANATLFPASDELEASCTCSDWEVPCKHIAGVYYSLAENFEENPFLLFYFRGRSKETILESLRGQHNGQLDESSRINPDHFVDTPLEQTLADFWEIGEELKNVTFNIAPPKQTMPHFKRLGRPAFTEMNIQTLLQPIYETVTEKAISWTFTKPENYRD